ncbi:hypothetical protein [Streptomyces sp. NPDC020571]|uniref:protein kinase domain-containing protein n=1 Tax=Streptomyces sp. NPDC020571 TaxID=3365079 RepID=UPI0037AAB733
MIHRDLKPSTIVLTADGPEFIDFGISRAADGTALTITGTRAGTPSCMAPQYIRVQEVAEAGDVLALGVGDHFAAPGRLAFGGGSDPAVAYWHHPRGRRRTRRGFPTPRTNTTPRTTTGRTTAYACGSSRQGPLVERSHSAGKSLAGGPTTPDRRSSAPLGYRRRA